ncbi:hypothetical protein PNOK_0972800 [Pyrrhoderma noxium]|uniref:Uncharacterized protein n=1 Tax=Pyrrhoderma noxium TaxID=2282107 RepID=A0A286U4Z4_9AGAM|nr:hypothetical protein PNOK_0972800 [Pyrrhoderma noxium]
MVILRYAPKIGLEETTSALDERYRRCMRPSSWKISRSNGRCFATAPKYGTIRITTSDETLNGTVLELRDDNWGTQGIRFTSLLRYEYPCI